MRSNREEPLSVLVTEQALVRLVVAHRTAGAELEKLRALGFEIDNDRLTPDLGEILLDMLGCPHDSETTSGLRDHLGIELEAHDLTEDAAVTWLNTARQMISARRSAHRRSQ
jgi:hypothetical protein